ncbi:O-antigen polymerase [Winogradskyella flava]|uniref:O-antigen polymerase n=1 Tax=Winogradskyella flava TaxID=1884876 RepID=UPI002492ED96|nr:O-antigen polymerase [Winogradskyella flava]
MKALRPVRLIFISFLLWLFFFLQMPVEYLYEGSLLFPIMSLLIYIISFVFGIISLKTNSIKKLISVSDRKTKQIIYLFFILGLFGVLLKVYVGFFKTEIFLSEDVFETRLENMAKELTGGFVGIIASIFFPFSFVSMLLAIYNYKIINRIILLFIILSGFYPFIETIFMGGRTTIALLGTTLLIISYASYNKNANIPAVQLKYLNRKLIKLPKFLFKKVVYIPLILVSILFISYSIEVVNKRLTRFGYGDRTFKVWEQKDYQWVKFDEDFKESYFKSNTEDKAKKIGIYSLKHYFAHGVIEYIRLVNDLESTTGYHYGQYQFGVFFKFFRAFGIPLKSNAEMEEVVSRKAVYKTFFGPFYIDFGLLGVIIIFFWGRFVKRIYTYAQRGHSQYVVFYGYLTTILLTSAFLNFLMGSSSYYLFAFFIGLLVFRFWPNNLKFVFRT